MEDNKKSKDKKVKMLPETKKMIIKRFIFIVLFLMITIGITVYFAITNMLKEEIIIEENEIKEIEGETIDTSSEKTLDLNGTYDVNDLDISEYKENYKDLELCYYQIDGLKDESIEVKINYGLKNSLEELIDKALEENKINTENFNVYPINYSNFANTISIYYRIISYEFVDEEYIELLDEVICHNYDLTTGNKIMLSDIFTKNTNIGNIFVNELYDDMIDQIAELDELSYTTYRVKDYNDIEDKMLDLTNRYNLRQDINFVFNEQHVLMIDCYGKIFYEDYVDNVVIYDKFATDTTIFDGTYSKPKALQTLVRRYDLDYQFIEKGENYYIDISMDYGWGIESENEAVFETTKKIIEDDIEKIKEEASQNKSKFLIINRAYLINNSVFDYNTMEYITYSDLMQVFVHACRFETTKSMFNSEVYDRIVNIFKSYPRLETGEAYCYSNMFGYYLRNGEEGEVTLEPVDDENEYREINISTDGTIVYDSIEDIPWEIDD